MLKILCSRKWERPEKIPPPIDPEVPTRRNGRQGRLFKVAVLVSISDHPDVIVESNFAEIFVPDTDEEYEPFPIASFDLKGYIHNKVTNMKEHVIITVDCHLRFWPPKRPGVEVSADFIQRAIQSNRDPNSRVEMGSQLIDKNDIEIYIDERRQSVGVGGVQTKFNRNLIPNQKILHIRPIPSQKRRNVSSPISKQTFQNLSEMIK